jgi:hypothetical protein
MNQATLLRESRSRHTLKSYDAAVKQLRAFKAVLPITSRNSESSAPTQRNPASTLPTSQPT